MKELINTDKTLSEQEIRDRIVRFENELLKHEQVEIPVVQYFCNGVYLRQIKIPAGTLLTGKIHKFPCLSIIAEGEIEVVTDQGPKHIKAPCVIESPAGVKRAGYAITDCVWITAHPWNGTELSAEEMSSELTVDTFEQLAEFSQEKLSCLT